MIKFNTNSLERYIIVRLILVGLPIPMFFSLWAISADFKPLWIFTGNLVLILVLIVFMRRFRRLIMATYRRSAMHLEAVNQEDYRQWSKPAFSQGLVQQFHQRLVTLSTELQEKKSRYDQHAFWIHQLITQLETPMLVFNAKSQLTFGNTGFYYLFNQPWQVYRHASPRLLGLEETPNGWQFADKDKNRQWQIRYSQFSEQGDSHQLLMFINIESALRQSQLKAWQQIIRVLGHEIRNSLTPVSSLAESMAARATVERDKTALTVITERCQHLQDFVSRYSSLTNKLQLSCQSLQLDPFITRIVGLFGHFEIQTQINAKTLWADASFIEQVLINLLKNAIEAKAESILLSVTQSDHYSVIKVVDDGQGFSNLDNLFVPLYSTKQQGQGIGLSFCRNIVEQHKGSIKLVNNPEQGVTITLQLPLHKTG
jgi:two-component system nitrogen regulation sensor histidine kinase NtrY